MAQDDLQKRLDNSMYGTPLIKPEEQKKYLGTFRERCYLTMNVRQMAKPELRANLITELRKYPEASVLLNGTLTSQLQATYIKLLTDIGAKFTIINDGVTNTPESVGLILAAKEAVNQDIIDIEEKYPKQINEQEKPEKKSFWGKLFH